MGTVGLAVTMADIRAQLDPDGSLAMVMEVLNESNPFMQRARMKEGNLPTGTQTTQRVSIPMPQVRVINQGITPDKSTVKQITDTCMMLEARSEIDVKLLKLQGGKAEAYRRSQDAAFIEGFAQTVAHQVFYGDTEIRPDEFNGLLPRYNKLGGTKNTAGYQVVSAGTAGTNTNTSLWIVGHGDHGTAMIYPKETTAGLVMQDLGESDATDAKGGKYRAVSTLFSWDIGMAVADIRTNARLANIDVNSLDNVLADSGKALALMRQIIKTKNKIRNLSAVGIDYVAYTSESMIGFLESYLIDKNNVHVTRQELQGKAPQLYVCGIPVDKMDAMTETEAAVV